MNAELLLAYFNHISDAPDAVPRLRRFILDLAVRGKLVEQDPSDESASFLLKRIQVAKSQLVKKQKETPDLNGTGILPTFPSGWEPVPLIALGIWAIGSGFPKNEQGTQGGPIFFLKVSDMNLPGNEKYIVSSQNTIDANAAQRMRALIHPPNTIIFPKIGGAIATNKRRILTRDSAIDNNCLGITFWPELPVEWCYLLLQSMDFAQYQAGTAVPALQQGVLETILVGLPPIAEQHRIIAKYDELMALCDRLETAQRERESRRDRLTAATHHHLNNGADAGAARSHAQFFISHLSCLTARFDQIKQLRQTVLNLAVRGKLVPQLSMDKDVKDIIASVKIIRERRFANKQMKPMGPLVTTGDEKQFDFSVPSSWQFCFVDDFALKVTDGEHATPERCQSGHYLLSARNVTNNGIDLTDVDFVPKAEFQRIRKRCDPDKNDVLISCSGSVGRIAVVDRDNAYSMVRSAALIKLDSSVINSNFVAYALRADPAQEQIQVYSKSTAQANLFIGAIRKLRLPLPPLAEQHRIVAKVDELMALCDQLEAQLTTAQTEAGRLLESVLHNALNDDQNRIEY
jgi:type I restriction enzyme S subunit